MKNPYAHAVINHKNSKRASAPVVGNANPEQLNFQRMTIDKNNAWNQAHEREEKRRKPLIMPKITTFQQLFAFAAACAILGEYVVDAQERIGAQSNSGLPPPNGTFQSDPEPDGNTQTEDQGSANQNSDDASTFNSEGASRSLYTGTADDLLAILGVHTGQSELQAENIAANLAIERAKRSNQHSRRKQKHAKYVVGRATSTITPSLESTCMSIAQNIFERLITRVDLGKFWMQMAGQDPMKIHTIRSIGGISDQGSENLTGIEVYIMLQKTAWGLTHNASAEIRALPDLDETFHDMTDSIEEQAYVTMREKINSTLMEKYGWHSVLGVGDHSVRDITLNEPTSFLGIPTGWSSVATSPVGYVLEYEGFLRKKFAFVIAPGHCDLLIPIPLDRPGQIEFIRKNSHLFFSPDLKLNGEDYGTKYTISIDEDRRYTYIEGAIEAMTKTLANRMVKAIKDDAFGETRREKLINLLQWHFPFYSAWIAYKKREYTEAGVRAALDAVALAGGPFASGLKKVGIILKSGTLQKMGNTLTKLSWLDVPGKVDAAKVFVPVKIATKLGGPSGNFMAKQIAREYNQGPKTNTMNQIMDEAYSGRQRDQKNMEGVRPQGNG
ncbi:hypothetical protein [Trinickia soli]|nr:hypothetical protein [Trinickia soli]CAB3719892.1 hypothetical protein LMG24076_04582 [Trinickia soli]